jgi:hypothetical protein
MAAALAGHERCAITTLSWTTDVSGFFFRRTPGAALDSGGSGRILRDGRSGFLNPGRVRAADRIQRLCAEDHADGNAVSPTLLITPLNVGASNRLCVDRIEADCGVCRPDQADLAHSSRKMRGIGCVPRWAAITWSCQSGSPRPRRITGWQMSEYPGFGILLARLLESRELDAQSLPGTEDEKGELRAVLAGAAPSRSLLCWLATALGMRVPDLYVVAGMEVPPELAPLDARAGPATARLAWQAGQLPDGRLSELLDFTRSLPQQDRAEPFPPPRAYELYPPGFGSVLARMLAARNLNWMSSVRVLHAVSLGRVYWSAATVGLVGRGRKEVTPALAAVFAAALGIAAGDLAAIGGIRLPADPEIPLNPSAEAMAELTWEARRLTAEQVKVVHREAEAMRHR